MSGKPEVPSTPFSIRLLGPFQIEAEGRVLPSGPTRKEQWLLALLLLRQGRAVERDWLASTLWPDSQRARVQLRDTLYDLRQTLGAQASRLFSPTSQTLQMNLTGAEVDLLTFDASILRGDSASLAQAVQLYRGALLEGCTEEWVFPEREAREHAYLHTLHHLAKEALARGEAALAVERLSRLLASDGLQEETLQTLLEALAACGNYVEMTRAYREFRLRLRADLQIEPSAETTWLYQKLREQAARSRSLDAAVRARAASVPTPSSLAGPAPTESAATLSPPSSPSSSLHCLPIPLSRLIGRESEREEIHLRLGSARLVTLTGSGGIGKTRLAIAICRERADLYADGIWFVELAALSDPSLVTQTLASALGVADSSEVPLLPSVTAFLRDRQALLVLDNCEHLLQTCAQLAAHLLKQCSSLRILATSRQGLGLTGEVMWRVPSLPLPTEQELACPDKERLSLLMSYEAIQLFVERAGEIDSHFRVTPSNLEAIVQICRHLDGIPLAIELAAARVNALSAEQLEARLDQRFRLLTGGSRAALPRQQTLRALIDWSYDLLEEPQKRLLERLSVFAGGWTLEAAERVCSGEGIEDWEVLDLLTALMDKSLAVYEHREGQARYRLQETVRQYSQERALESGTAERFRDRHLASFLALAEEAEPHLKSANQAAWLERLEAEHDNLRAALNSSLRKNGAGEEGLRLCIALWRFWIMRGHLSEGLVWCNYMLAGSGSREPAQVRANVLGGAGNLALKLGDMESAGAYFAECLSIRRALGDRLGIATSLNNLGLVADTCGDRAAAIACFEESLAIHREIGHRSGMAWVLRSLGGMTLSQGNHASARPYFEECLAIFREIGERNGIAAALNNLGTIALAAADPVSARAYFEECLSIFREIGELSGIVSCLTYLVLVTAHQGDFTAARAYGDECLLLLKGSSDRRCMVNMLRLCASDAFQIAQCDRAAVLWGAERALWESITWGGEPYSQDRYPQQVAACRQALGEAAFSAAWESGRALSIEKAFRIALDRSSV